MSAACRVNLLIFFQFSCILLSNTLASEIPGYSLDYKIQIPKVNDIKFGCDGKIYLYSNPNNISVIYKGKVVATYNLEIESSSKVPNSRVVDFCVDVQGNIFYTQSDCAPSSIKFFSQITTKTNPLAQIKYPAGNLNCDCLESSLMIASNIAFHSGYREGKIGLIDVFSFKGDFIRSIGEALPKDGIEPESYIRWQTLHKREFQIGKQILYLYFPHLEVIKIYEKFNGKYLGEIFTGKLNKLEKKVTVTFKEKKRISVGVEYPNVLSISVDSEDNLWTMTRENQVIIYNQKGQLETSWNIAKNIKSILVDPKDQSLVLAHSDRDKYFLEFYHKVLQKP